jgi:large subunit ribosomal protein L3
VDDGGTKVAPFLLLGPSVICLGGTDEPMMVGVGQMSATLIGRKIGMTRFYDDAGCSVPVTIIEAGPCFVSQLKTNGSDGYDAVQLAFEDIKARRSTQPVIGHDAKAELGPMRVHREFRLKTEQVEQLELGQQLTVENFKDVKYVDVIGTSKGKGFAGVMKRHGFKGFPASHGTERKHRAPGSVSGRSSNLGTGKPKKGIRMNGHMGDAQVTVRSVEVLGHDEEKNLLLVKGPVPGSRKGLLLIREATRLYKRKVNKGKKG